MNTLGKLFVFEGPDDSGKTTLAREFACGLVANGVQCEYLSFPGHKPGSLGEHVYRLHHESRAFDIESIHPASLQVLHIAAHIDQLESTILPMLSAGKIIILDRYWWSTRVYGIVGGVDSESLAAMLRLELLHWKTVLPAALFLLNRDLVPDRAPATRKNPLNKEYVKLSREDHNFPVFKIANNGTVEEALASIMRSAVPLLPGYQGRDSSLGIDRTQVDLPFGKGREPGPPPTILTGIEPAKASAVFDTYWRFAAERQAVFFRRLDRAQAPWTEDPIILEHKFTNAYRASDRVSQYLIRNVIYAGDQEPEEVFFRTLLFKLFNKIETWELLEKELGKIAWDQYGFDRYDKVLGHAWSTGITLYSGAYIMPSGRGAYGYKRKYRTHLKLLESMIKDSLPARIADAKTMGDVFSLLRSYPTIGDFLAYQYATDLNYSTLTDFPENQFVVAGPGAKDGIRKCFVESGGLKESDIIKLMVDRQGDEFERLGLDFQSLWGRPLQLIDCQNLFCEVGKYARVAHPTIKGISNRMRIKQRFHANREKLNPWYPPKWHLNDIITSGARHVSTD